MRESGIGSVEINSIMNIETLTGVAASACTAVSLIPQLVTVIKKKKAENISVGMMLVLFVGLALWIVYGVLKHDYIIIVSNGISFLVNLLLGFATYYYRKK